MVLMAHGILLYDTYCVRLRKHNVLSMFVFEVVMVGPFFQLGILLIRKRISGAEEIRSGKLMSHPTCFKP